jgi:hypothetical protein
MKAWENNGAIDWLAAGSNQDVKENNRLDSNVLDAGTSDPQTPLKAGCAPPSGLPLE